MELWDAYDKNMKVIEDLTLVRGEPIPEGVYHLVCNVLVRRSDGDILIMQRDPHKHHGGMWEATAGGSALQGENQIECALRELKEETGIVAQTLELLGTYTSPDRIYVDYITIGDWNKNDITLQEGETVAFRWVTKAELLDMKEGDLVSQRMIKYISEL